MLEAWNVYGTDITGAKVVEKFPDQNPNPVLRVPPASPADALAYFTGLMTYSTDVSDVHAATENDDRCRSAWMPIHTRYAAPA